jgi:hypothetical protein
MLVAALGIFHANHGSPLKRLLSSQNRILKKKCGIEE